MYDERADQQLMLVDGNQPVFGQLPHQGHHTLVILGLTATGFMINKKTVCLAHQATYKYPRSQYHTAAQAP